MAGNTVSHNTGMESLWAAEKKMYLEDGSEHANDLTPKQRSSISTLHGTHLTMEEEN